MIELIKNAYDADASCVYVCFDMPFPEVPDTLPAAGLREMLREEDYYEVLKCYMTEGVGSREEADGLQGECQVLLLSRNYPKN